MTLLYTYSWNFTWDEGIISENINIASIFRNFISWHFWTKPLNNVSMVFTFNIDCINIVLKEMSMFFNWKFCWGIILAKVYLNSIFTKVGQKVGNNLSLLCSNFIHILLTDFCLLEGIESVKEWSKMSVFSFFYKSCNSGTLWLIFLLQEPLTDLKSWFLFLYICFLTNPEIDLFMQF